MIGYVKGILEEADDQCIIVDNHGIGYRIFVPGSVFSGAIPIGQEVKIYTYLNVKEDAMQLYGFATRDDLRVFKLLLGVNGIGPKAGLGILSALSADDLRFAVLADDAAAIAKAPGIGKKTAQKLILELKDKLDLEDAFEQKLANQSAAGIPETEEDNQLQEAVQALEDRKSRARQLGEEAGTRLLIPMLLMLIIVITIVVVPAFLSIQV